MDLNVTKAGDRSTFDVAIGEHHILAVVSSSTVVLADWLKEVSLSDSTTIVALSAVREEETATDPPFGLLCISDNIRALLFYLPQKKTPEFNIAARNLSSFFEEDSIVAVGFNSSFISDNLRNKHRIRIGRFFDVRDDGFKRRKIGHGVGGDETGEGGGGEVGGDAVGEVVGGSGGGGGGGFVGEIGGDGGAVEVGGGGGGGFVDEVGGDGGGGEVGEGVGEGGEVGGAGDGGDDGGRGLDEVVRAVLGEGVVMKRPAIGAVSLKRPSHALISSVTLDLHYCYLLGLEFSQEIEARDYSPDEPAPPQPDKEQEASQ